MVFVFLALVLIIKIISERRFAQSPEQGQRTTVAEKRIIAINGGEDFDSYNYIVAFRFPDNLVKEFSVGYGSKFSKKSRYFYDSLHIGEVGILTYKELEFTEEKYKYKGEDLSRGGRRFISFEKETAAA
ncbi:MAG: DUF2500 domain-containing protein [Oscillospiraceae bacterium]|nr:DUF2500 domain-containing protein [Oscillospiraceae bacterium]